MARLRDLYKSKVVPALREKYNYRSPMAVPRVQKVVIAMGIGRATQDKKFLETALQDLTLIAGQKPLICKAKKSVSNFKVREGEQTGLKVTLRGQRMYEFMDRLINLAIPRVKDFRGLNPNSFDGRGNYSMGMSEQTVFPEIDSAKMENVQGMDITFVTTARTNDEAKEMLKLFGMPFRESN
ncbi:MAG: 50S ribosomal protein L5 [Planctomycetes bacterium]|nr:50S ribosomal protein L5 [Planctomycetota bacterium]MBU1517318.1 50S ribosomal protein L5 [Planctomycetota bacterium]MBU2458422.1 50S ribosomal protein L5 [Planctomycetota bacterium]MBU2596442.1 50S ribosomal protein L5 [Planctomycetota bacterium]